MENATKKGSGEPDEKSASEGPKNTNTTKDPTDFTADTTVMEMEQSPVGSPTVKEESVKAIAAENTEQEASTKEPPLPLQFDKFWKVVEDNFQDFSGWTYLLQFVEQENHIKAARKAFDKFFSHYPYCYGYWKKYADFEKRHQNLKQSEEVYRRGLQAIPLSVDLWIHYINFLKETLDPNNPESNNILRGTFEHGVLAAGTDFRSDRLWDMYINWENEQKNLRGVTTVYFRLLNIPTQLYNQHFQRFREHIQTSLPRDCLTADKFIQLRKELASVSSHGTEGAPAGGDMPSGLEDITDPAKLITEIENMRHRIIEIYQEVFNHNEHEVNKRWTFEEGIKRPYFHVKPLEKAQLKNWKEYLDFEIENGTHERVVVLFERCVISCALYEDFWIKYAKYMENHSTEGVRHVYRRACTIHLPKKPMAHLLWAAFEEQQGNISEARRILKTLEERVEGLAMVRLRRVSLERRHRNMEEAERLLEDAVKKAKSSSESSFYAIKLSRHLFKVQKNLPKARKVLLEAIEKEKENTKLYLNWLEIEYSGDLKQNEENILACFDKAVNGSLSVEMRITFSQRKVEFLEDFGLDVNKLLNAYDEHQKLLREQESLKRKAENGSEEPDEKKPHIEDATISSQMSGDMQGSQDAYNYGSWYEYNYQNHWNYGQYYPSSST
ncbi:pre-mRNA-processing factor 39 [Rhinatrema bivittatum]|uniref:pre-mRNA-processing factor 39 n=1 Tax=Rhinatrema bivittatum TaxID=194408 RepID=UPI00112E65CD|nr:pre-mRNA-processing factor 39 [Rhinatrema bivittatum]XP_029454334.1 pre-mRNA-processing factor 39 [Rhinatrema bivittatum]